MKLKHPDSKASIDVSPDMAPMYESQGWQKVTAPAKKSAPAKTSAASARTDTGR